MRKLFLLMIVLYCFGCSEDDSSENDDSAKENCTIPRKRFENFTKIEFALFNFEKQTRDWIRMIKESDQSYDCVQNELQISNEDSPILSFDTYKFYDRIIIDQTVASCFLPSWTGRIEYYSANEIDNMSDEDNVVSKKDSVVYKNFSSEELSYDGYSSLVSVTKSNSVLNTNYYRFNGVLNTQGINMELYARRDFKDSLVSNNKLETVLRSSSIFRDLDDGCILDEDTLLDRSLIFNSSCFINEDLLLKYPVKGIRSFAATGQGVFYINYGSGDCDKEVVLEFNEGDPRESQTFDIID